jgi:hypothetical protein
MNSTSTRPVRNRPTEVAVLTRLGLQRQFVILGVLSQVREATARSFRVCVEQRRGRSA